MRIKTVGLAVLVVGSMMGDGLAQQTLEDEIQQEEAPVRPSRWISDPAERSLGGNGT
jgi:hypothetical protein